ncbi:hypothetical protein ABT56_11380 [Photobacterium aquae]|uniref:Uncharacterized protein n=1 Tax=Photobacterium aquae TaxID=1195763 RepID=A0A0J1H193_9GAMM|nr:hypothetical protein [Photobacterium aquae]KLV05559.1 hypothetical protein ABT56_11380 [Photobacterium aquae]
MRPTHFKWLLHGMTLAPLAHLVIGVPVYFILFAGSFMYAIGLLLFILGGLLPFEFVQSAAMTYTVSGKLLVGMTFYQGWPVPLFSLIPAAYVILLVIVYHRLKGSNFQPWIGYDIDTLWRTIFLSLVLGIGGLLTGVGLNSAMWISGWGTTGYLLYRICHFYVPLWSRRLRQHLASHYE